MSAPTLVRPVYDPQAFARQLERVDERVQVAIVHPWVPLPCTVCQDQDTLAAAHIVWVEPDSPVDGHADPCTACAVDFLRDWVVPACGDPDVHRAPIDVQVGRWVP